MNLTPHRFRDRRSPRSRRQRNAAAGAAFGVAAAAALVFVYAAVLGPTIAGTTPLLAGFEARSYAPGQTAVLEIDGGAAGSVTSPGLPGRRARSRRARLAAAGTGSPSASR